MKTLGLTMKVKQFCSGISCMIEKSIILSWGDLIKAKKFCPGQGCIKLRRNWSHSNMSSFSEVEM